MEKQYLFENVKINIEEATSKNGKPYERIVIVFADGTQIYLLDSTVISKLYEILYKERFKK